MENLSLEQINNMGEAALRQTLRDVVIERQRSEQAEAEQKKAEAAAKAKEEEQLNSFFANKLKNKSPRFGDQY